MKTHRLLIIGLSLVTLTSCGGKDVVTYSEVRRIQPYMTLQDVEKIVGQKGTLSTGKEDIDGMAIPTQPGEQVYYWQNKDRSSLNITLLKGHVTSLATTGLP